MLYTHLPPSRSMLYTTTSPVPCPEAPPRVAESPLDKGRRNHGHTRKVNQDFLCHHSRDLGRQYLLSHSRIIQSCPTSVSILVHVPAFEGRSIAGSVVRAYGPVFSTQVYACISTLQLHAAHRIHDKVGTVTDIGQAARNHAHAMRTLIFGSHVSFSSGPTRRTCRARRQSGCAQRRCAG